MENLEMQDAFLGYLYNLDYAEEDSTLKHIDGWVKTTKMDRNVFWKYYETMIKSELVQFVQDEATVRLTPKGTLHVEKSGLISADLIAKNREIRKRLMNVMATCLTNKSSTIYITDIAREMNLSEGECISNMHLLVGMGYARWQVPSEQLVISARVCAKVGTIGATA